MEKKINIRVYGLLINSQNEILVSDELRFNTPMTKFPGGGLEWGESPIECLKREFKEELNCSIQVNDLFYISDFFLESAFHKNVQIISIYYLVTKLDFTPITINHYPLYEIDKENHRWISIEKLQESDFTFPFEKKVCQLLKKING
ncbi:MAG: NUDIX hydrolase [Flavobacteriia bacterium]|nr:NUDIX hydrolase [Flavobacteriia bacterium]